MAIRKEKRKAARKAALMAELEEEARYFARRCGLTADEALTLLLEARDNKHAKTDVAKNKGDLVRETFTA